MFADLLDYDLPLWRPPSEGRNLIIQATIGCSFNRCSFCSMYRSKQFRPRPLDEVFADIERAARSWPDAQRVFLADGDALVLPVEQLHRILDKLAESLPALARVASYALPANLIKKSVAELESLAARKLNLVYYGIESGSHDILKRITKGASPRAMVDGLSKAKTAGLKVSATVILGLGGRARWREHIDATAALINQAAPTYLSTLQLGLEPELREEFFRKFGEPFEFQDDAAVLEEQRHLIDQLEPPSPVIFRSNHASNALPLAGTLPKDRAKAMKRSFPIKILVVFVLAFALAGCASDSKVEEQQALVDSANASVKRFGADPDMSWFRENLNEAEGVLIIPTSLKGGFIIGGSGGSGVMLARNPVFGWSYPAFYTMGSITFGLQIGGEVSEIVLVIMTKAGRDAMLTNEFKLGGDISVAAGPVGAGAKAQTADVLAYSRTKGGLYGGLNLEGAVIATREDWNRSYYGEDVRAVDILVTGRAKNPAADPLRDTVAKIDTPAE